MLNNFQDVCQLMELQDLEPVSPVQVKGRLKQNIAFWKNIGASKWVLSVIENGYYLPFISLPARRSFRNHPSVVQNQEFVCQELKKLLASGAVVEVRQEDVLVVNPLGVVNNASGKSRLILDLRYVNNHLRSCKFKYEGIPAASELFQKDDWVFTFDYKSGYHHLDIFAGHTTFLGCSFQLDGKLRYFKFTVLPFGLATGPYVFTKIQRALVKHWRSRGFRIFTYLDDGAGGEQGFAEACSISESVRKDVRSSGFVANEEKSMWMPSQYVELLGFIMDLKAGTFHVPPRRVDALKQLLDIIIAKDFRVSARTLSRLTGSLVSMSLAMGPVVRLWTRAMYRDICAAPCWDQPICLSSDSRSEVLFWKQNFDNSGYPIWAPSSKVEVLSYSDASGLGWGGFAVHINGKPAVGSWSEEESGRSSTFRELRAIRYVLESYSGDLRGKEVCHRTDNRNAEIIMSVGSRIPDLHREAVLVYKLCHELNIRLSVEWVSRDDNSIADELSRVEDATDYMLDPKCFHYVDRLWGPHTVDRFASIKTKQLVRYCSRYRNPGCEASNAFTVSWSRDNNWIFPPPMLIPRVLRHMSAGHEYGTLIAPEWPSAVWWPLLVDRSGTWKSFIKDCLRIEPYQGIFLSGSAASSVFTSGIPSFAVLAFKICFDDLVEST